MTPKTKARILNARAKGKAAPSPLKYDPSRTLSLRRALCAELTKRFARVKAKVVKLLVDEDALGLNPAPPLFYSVAVGNAEDQPRDELGRFTGAGVTMVGKFSTETAKKISDTLTSLAKEYEVPASELKVVAHTGQGYRGLTTRGVKRTVGKEEADAAKAEGRKVMQADREGKSFLLTDSGSTISFKQDLEKSSHAGVPGVKMDPVEQTATHEFGHVLQHRAGMANEEGQRSLSSEESEAAKSLGRNAGTNYAEFLAEAFVAHRAGKGDYSKHLSRLGVKPPSVTVNTRWKAQTSPQKVQAFQAWLRDRLKEEVTDASGEELMRRYAELGFRQGAGRAWDDTKKVARGQQTLDFYAETKDQFLRDSFARPVSQERIEMLAARSFDDLENVTEDMATRMSRELTDGLVEGKGPREIARDLSKQADVSRDRALTIARTEVVRAHSEGQLNSLERMGVGEVGVQVEWVATDDGRACPLCEAMVGAVSSIEDAKGQIPHHPNCRCAWVPELGGTKPPPGSLQGAESPGEEGEATENRLSGNALRAVEEFGRSWEVAVRNRWVTLGDDSNNPGQPVWMEGEEVHAEGPPDESRDPKERTANPRLSEGSRPLLTAKETEAVLNYSKEHFDAVNGYLRGGLEAEDMSDGELDTLKHLRSALEKAKPLSKTVVAHRGVQVGDGEDRAEFFSKYERALQDGEPVEHQGFVSTTTHPKAAGFKDFAAMDARYEIVAKKGLDLKPHSDKPEEHELLLDHGTRFRVKSVDRAAGVVRLEQLL